MDLKGNMEVSGLEDVPEAETTGGPMRTPGGDEEFSGINSGGQKTEGEYEGDVY